MSRRQWSRQSLSYQLRVALAALAYSAPLVGGWLAARAVMEMPSDWLRWSVAIVAFSVVGLVLASLLEGVRTEHGVTLEDVAGAAVVVLTCGIMAYVGLGVVLWLLAPARATS